MQRQLQMQTGPTVSQVYSIPQSLLPMSYSKDYESVFVRFTALDFENIEEQAEGIFGGR